MITLDDNSIIYSDIKIPENYAAFIKKGFLDGIRGLILCKIAAFSVFLKYYKLYHIQNQK